MFDRLQKVGICLLHSNTIKLVGFLGDDFDEPVKKWKEHVEQQISSLIQVNYHIG